ncbi:MAG TPA: hypothetical protein VNY82_15405 [Steroidobacteraceae bacterium]|nr:hypothetical protein [Steroidobacteraceae bacterium]
MYDRTPRWIVVGLLAVSVSPVALAQQSPPPPAPATPAHSAPRPEDLEPGVNTSAPAPASTGPGAVTPQSASPLPGAAASGQSDPPPAAPKVGKSSASAKSAASAKPSGSAAAAGKPAAGASAGPAGPNSGARGKEDRLQLDTTEITGNQELPKVLYIVPWKRADLGDLLGKPANSLLDEVLQPVDRDVFKRENRYYDALKPDAAGGADKAAGAAGQGSGDKR